MQPIFNKKNDMSLEKKSSLKIITRVLSAIAGIILFITLFLPIWKIELDAPQYPEGLEMYIHAGKLSGEVDIINGLNHYIGMKELHAEDFIEFTVLPYLIGFFALLGLAVALVNRKWLLYVWLIGFAIFGIATVIDFYFWLYDYGHDLDPTAPIQVPGMTYQPPLIGFKQLLNFGAYSIPAIGGWLMFGAVFLMGTCFGLETNFKKKKS